MPWHKCPEKVLRKNELLSSFDRLLLRETVFEKGWC